MHKILCSVNRATCFLILRVSQLLLYKIFLLHLMHKHQLRFQSLLIVHQSHIILSKQCHQISLLISLYFCQRIWINYQKFCLLELIWPALFVLNCLQSRIKNFGDWCDTFAVFMGIFVQKAPGKVTELIAYYLLISKAVKESPNSGWLNYNNLFKESAWNYSSLTWGIVKPSLWVTHMLDNSKGLVRNFESKKPSCQLFNQNRCFHTDSKYNCTFAGFVTSPCMLLRLASKSQRSEGKRKEIILQRVTYRSCTPPKKRRK